MKIKEIIQAAFSPRILLEDKFIIEMANFIADTTDLPANIVLWCKTQPEGLPHTKFRMKVFKDRRHVATFSIGQHPIQYWEISNKKFRLNSDETYETISVISKYATLFIQYIDGTLTTDQTKEEMKKIKGTI